MYRLQVYKAYDAWKLEALPGNLGIRSGVWGARTGRWENRQTIQARYSGKIQMVVMNFFCLVYKEVTYREIGHFIRGTCRQSHHTIDAPDGGHRHFAAIVKWFFKRNSFRCWAQITRRKQMIRYAYFSCHPCFITYPQHCKATFGTIFSLLNACTSVLPHFWTISNLFIFSVSAE